MNQKTEAKKYFSLLIRIGLTMVLSIGLGFCIGLVLEKAFNLGGVMIISGVFSGVAIGMYLVVVQIKRVLV